MGLFTVLATVLSVKDCGAGKALFGINELSITPDVKPGDPITLHMKYTVPEGLLITDGDVKYSVTYNFIPFAPTTEPLCANVPCPLGPGTYTNDTVSRWPTGLSGSMTTKIEWLDEAKRLLACISISGKTR